MAQLERAHSRLQTERERLKEAERVKGGQKESHIQVEQTERLRTELISLQSLYNKLR